MRVKQRLPLPASDLQAVEVDASHVVQLRPPGTGCSQQEAAKPACQTGVGSASAAHMLVPNCVNNWAVDVLSVCSLASAAPYPLRSPEPAAVCAAWKSAITP